jgi:hypothetical protein
MSKISVTLSAANMGDQATEADFDKWAAFCAEHLPTLSGLESATVEVDQFAFTGRGAEAEDKISGANEEQRETIKRFVSVDGWDSFCTDGSWAA